MNIQIRDKDIQRIMQSPEFMPELLKMGADVAIDADKIPELFKEWVLTAIRDVPFSELKLPLEDYKKLYSHGPIEWTITTVQKMCNLLLAVKPSTIMHPTIVDLSFHYKDIVTYCVTLHNECARIIKDLQEKTIEKLYTRERLSGKI